MPRPRRDALRQYALAVCVAAAVLTGCAAQQRDEASPPTGVAADPPPGFEWVRDGRAGIAVAIPSSWTRPDVTSITADEAVRTARQSNPRLAQAITAALADVRRGSAIFRLLAVGEAEGSAVSLVVRKAARSSLEQDARSAVRQAQQAGLSARYERTVIGGEPAIRLTACCIPDRSSADGDVTAYEVKHGGRLVTLSTTGASPKLATVVGSLRLRSS
jgi:hypothetical protein